VFVLISRQYQPTGRVPVVEDVVDAVTHRERLLRALLVVDHDLDRDLRVPAVPADLRRVLAVAHDFPRRPGHLGVGAAEELVVGHAGLSSEHHVSAVGAERLAGVI
jgi:hypothetical protein